MVVGKAYIAFMPLPPKGLPDVSPKGELALALDCSSFMPSFLIWSFHHQTVPKASAAPTRLVISTLRAADAPLPAKLSRRPMTMTAAVAMPKKLRPSSGGAPLVSTPVSPAEAPGGRPMPRAICFDASGLAVILPWMSSMPEAVARSTDPWPGTLHEIATHGSTKARSAITLAIRTTFITFI